jgi:ZIP family zinc transporter
MSAGSIALLGAIAGLTIFLGLPIGRLGASMARTRALLNAIAIGVLVFLVWDILAHAWAPVDGAVAAHDWGAVAGNGTVLALGLAGGLLGLVYFDRWTARRRASIVAPQPSMTAPQTSAVAAPKVPVSVGAKPAADEVLVAAPQAIEPADTAEAVPAPGFWRAGAGQLALLIAIGIGLHNFAEGLAIGNSAASGAISLALLLVIGFAAHNATEGFGIVAPLAAASIRPSWGQLALLGLIGGGPTLVGTLIGQRVVNDTLSIAFLALAAGSILYVVMELLAVARRLSRKEWTSWGLLAGLLAGFATDAILVAAGA